MYVVLQMSEYLFELKLSVLSWNSPESELKTRVWVQVIELGRGQVRQAREGNQYRVY